jgi:DNA-binding PadR family transcriptional regulator
MSTIDVSMDDARTFLPLSPQQFQILLALSDADRHGYGIILEVAERTAGAMRLGTGTLYTALAGLVDSELIREADTRSRTAVVGNGSRTREDARRRYYRLTPFGRAVLEAETARLDALVKQARRKGITIGRPTLEPSSTPSRGK